MKCSREKCRYKAIKRGVCKKHYENLPLKGDIPRGPVAERVRLLRLRGYSWEALEAATGMSIGCLILDNPCVRAETAAKVLAVPVPARIADFGGIVPSIGSCRRLRALMAIGYPQNVLADELGVDRRNLCRICAKPGTSAALAVRIDELFQRLELIPGPSDGARRWAARRGWPAPMDWDEDTIDDPDAQPAAPVQASVTWLDRYQELKELGVPESRIPERMGMKSKSFERQLMRLGITKGAA